METNTNLRLSKEMLLEIFSRLPAKSVGKCRCLSKSWRSNLSSPSFIKKHLITRQNTNQQQSLALVNSSGLFIVTSPLRNDEQVHQLPMPLGEICPLSTCHGLIMGSISASFISLINPITLQQIVIPRSASAASPLKSYLIWEGLADDESIVYGFGYDSSTDDFKVIKLTSPDPYEVTLVDVYSVKRRVWNRVDYPYGKFTPVLTIRPAGAFVNGAVHWFICDGNGFHHHIAAFDLANEVFVEIPIPAEFDRNRRHGSGEYPLCLPSNVNGLTVLAGRLSIVDNLGTGATDIWVMNEYGVGESWVRYHIAAHEYGETILPLCFVGDEQLLCNTDKRALVACDLKAGITKKLILGGGDNFITDGVAFDESLVPPRN